MILYCGGWVDPDPLTPDPMNPPKIHWISSDRSSWIKRPQLSSRNKNFPLICVPSPKASFRRFFPPFGGSKDEIRTASDPGSGGSRVQSGGSWVLRIQARSQCSVGLVWGGRFVCREVHPTIKRKGQSNIPGSASGPSVGPVPGPVLGSSPEPVSGPTPVSHDQTPTFSPWW